MSEQIIAGIPLKQKLLKSVEILLVSLFTVFLAVVMAFFYEDIGYVPSVALIIIFAVIFFPKFLRRNFNTDKKDNLEIVKSIDYQSSIGSFFWTRPDKTGLFPYREFVTSFTKSGKKQLQGKIFYIDFKTKCLVATAQVLYMISLPFAFVYASKIKDPITSFFAILIIAIVFIKSYDGTRNFIIKKLAKKILNSN